VLPDFSVTAGGGCARICTVADALCSATVAVMAAVTVERPMSVETGTAAAVAPVGTTT
jgi:hypothetical protein